MRQDYAELFRMTISHRLDNQQRPNGPSEVSVTKLPPPLPVEVRPLMLARHRISTPTPPRELAGAMMPVRRAARSRRRTNPSMIAAGV
jgi:hypothetical protein